MPKADETTQRALLTLADVDRDADAARAARDGLPEHAVIAAGLERRDTLQAALVLARADADDLAAAVRKLDDEIDAVRARAARDEELLAGGSVSAKEAESLQGELASLARRQATLEDEALELMERRETAAEGLARQESELAAVAADLTAATATRDAAVTEFDRRLAAHEADRTRLRAEIAEAAEALLTIYDRVRGAGKTAATRLAGSTCGSCQIALDAASVEEIRSAPADEVPRCPECGALLVRFA